MIYDLEERTIKFSLDLLIFLKVLKVSYLNKDIISQLIRSSSSVGANYREANGSSSRKDFKNRILICKREIKETEYWIELLAKIEDSKKDQLRIFWREARELTLIFSKINSSLRN